MISSSMPAFPVILLHPGTKSWRYFIRWLILSLLTYATGGKDQETCIWTKGDVNVAPASHNSRTLSAKL